MSTGLYEIHSGHIRRGDDGPEVTTTVREVGGRKPGRRLLWGAVWFLVLLAGVCFYVSYDAQFRFVFAVKQVTAASAAEALIPDTGMAICAMLALAMAVQGRSAKAARVAVVAFAALSALMNYAAADPRLSRSVLVYVMPPVAFAVCTDLVVSAVRRFYYGVEDGTSPWRLLGAGVLYVLRLILDWGPTRRGLRQMVLDAAPLPGQVPAAVQREVSPAGAGTKKDRLISAYRRHPEHGVREAASRVAGELAGDAGLQPGTARTYIYQELASMNGAAR